MSVKTESVKTVKTEVGAELLRKATAAELDAKRYYGGYVKWVAECSVPEGIVITQLIEISGYSPRVAEKKATLIIRLGQPQNEKHLNDLINGKIDLWLALARVQDRTSRPVERNDEEEAQRCADKIMRIMRLRHKKWNRKDLIAWFESLCKASEMWK